MHIRSTIQIPSLKKPEPTPVEKSEDFVVDQFSRYFDQWDRDQNGQISWSEMRQNVASPMVEGEEAVALATLYATADYDHEYRGLKRPSPIKYNQLFDLFYDYDTNDGEPVADHYYKKFSKKLAQAGESLFQGPLKGVMARQGTAPSCGFLATTFGQASKDSIGVQNAIRRTEDGDFEVKFPGLDRPITVTKPTDTERALFSTATTNGTWITVLEKAWGKLQAKGDALRAFEMTTYPEDAIRAWTNGSAKTIRVPKNPQKVLPDGLPDYLRTTNEALSLDRSVVAWTRMERIEGKDFVPGHAYTVLGIDLEQGTVALRNPWGRLEPTNDEGVPLDGVDDGVFDYPLKKFHVTFKNIARQTG